MTDPRAHASADRVPRWTWWVGLGLLALGGGVVYLGAHIDGLGSYDQSVFVNVGTGVALVGPLFVAERLLSRRIAAVGTRVATVEQSADLAQATAEVAQTRLDELIQQVREGVNDIRAEDDLRRRRVVENQSQKDLVDLYRRAARKRSIDRRGLRVPAGELDYWLLVRAVERAPDGKSMWLVEVGFEDSDLEIVGDRVTWSPDEPVSEVFIRLAHGLQQANRWPGDDYFDPANLLTCIADGLAKVIDIRTGPQGDSDVRQIVEVIGEDWAVTREGLDSLHSSNAWAEHHELVGDTRHAFGRIQAQSAERSWDDGAFRRAFGTAERIHAAFAAQRPGA